MKALGEVAIDLPWLSPCAAALVALAREPAAAAWLKVRTDPGCVLLLVRHALPACSLLQLEPWPAALREGEALRAALAYLQSPRALGAGDTFADWQQPALRSIHQTALQYARLAYQLALKSRRCEPDLAWVAGLLAPLGWLALAAAAPAPVETCLKELTGGRDPEALQQQFFGMDCAALARRLNLRWQLPAWLSAITGHLGLPWEIARSLGADGDLFRVVQLAVGLVEQRGRGLALAWGDETPWELAAALELDAATVKAVCEEICAPDPANAAEPRWEPPASQPLLLDLLQLALENRRAREALQAERLQRDVEALQKALRHSQHTQRARLHQQKMTALAEFAAGAAHEINNPMAVISGQAQYLLGREADPGRRQSLQKIVAQTQRVHQILTEVLLFARPPAPQKQLLDLEAVLREAINALRELATERRVRLVCPDLAAPITLSADPTQLGKALNCLLRNAIEAAPEDGWAGVRVEMPQPDVLDLVVEDNGKGPPASDTSLLFDPFYSGRSAGRGRGLGLPVAWRLARLHDGEIFLAAASLGPTRLVLRLPLPPVPTPTLPRNGVHESPKIVLGT